MSLDVACYLILAEHVSSPQIMFHDVSVQGGWLLYFLMGSPEMFCVATPRISAA